MFTDLARKARSLARHEVLGGWLYRSTQFAGAAGRSTSTRASATAEDAGDSPGRAKSEWREVTCTVGVGRFHPRPVEILLGDLDDVRTQRGGTSARFLCGFRVGASYKGEPCFVPLWRGFLRRPLAMEDKTQGVVPTESNLDDSVLLRR